MSKNLFLAVAYDMRDGTKFLLLFQALQVVQSSEQCGIKGYRYTIIQADLYEKAGDFHGSAPFPR